ncbi:MULTISPECIES: YadA-like family protein [Pasteurellaceae]|uniref:YadA-like family protein n=1 Tax=Pasteurella atlantica TaxID=2827233 RepID=A0AAW8CPD9_9PAST|nr:YadA-like family protein [Pasteurella atlantica]MBR0573831.1 YadA-like family protein [Pasteurella atlantica]MDP8039223.1 YadA-like family protein [Pasteurella atlantica]MDP8041314.1 YadA-like family protein [Pasteurella atlantica]MDP8043450.1 YadA-like family protein [Pasteurella atlantica]MDP8045631.1 YadA-like family protein [Pasteurella atlantica]
MNKVYKVVFNRSLQVFTVVSELAKGRTKNQSTILSSQNKHKKHASIFCLSKIALILSTIFSYGTAMAAFQVSGGGDCAFHEDVHGNKTILICGDSTTKVKVGSSGDAAQHSIAVGRGTVAVGTGAIAMGSAAKALNSGAIAMGMQATAGEWGTAIGGNANSGEFGVAAGAGARAIQNGVALGKETMAGENGIALGPSANSDYFAIAVGSGASAAHKGVAMGNEASAESFGIALGSNASAAGGSVALGENASAVKQGVALGVGSRAGGQLGKALGPGASATGGWSVSIGTGEVTGLNAVGLGHNVSASGISSTSIGEWTNSSERFSLAMGVGTKSSGESSFAVGALATASGTTSVAMGGGSKALGVGSFAVGGAQLYDASIWMGVGGIKGGFSSLLEGATAHSRGSIAIGSATVAGQSGGEQQAAAIGYGARATENNTLALGFDAVANHENSVALGSEAETREDAQVNETAVINGLKYKEFSGFADGVVSVGKAYHEKQIINVAPGEIAQTSTDAINGSQLFATNTVLGNVAQSVKNNFGGNAAIDEDGNITFTNIGGTGKNTINEAIAKIKTLNSGAKADKNADNLGTTEVNAWTTKLNTGANITTPTGKLVTDTQVNTALNTKLDADDIISTDKTVGITTAAGKVDLKVNLNEASFGTTVDGKITLIDDAVREHNILNGSVTKAKLAGDVTNILDKVGTGAVETGNQKTVTGGAVKTYVDTATAGKLNKADLNVIESEDITVSNSGDLTKGKVKLSLKADKVKALAGTTNLATTYLKADGTNIAGNKVTFGGNVGTATLANTTELAQIKAVKAVDDKVAVNTQSITNLGDQITNVGKTSKEEVAIVQNSGLTLAKTVETANKGAVYTLGLDAVKVKEVAGTTTLAADLAAKANKDASNLTDPADVGKWKKKLGIDGLATNANIASKLEADDIISTDKTVGIDTATTAGKVDLKVNLDGTTLTKDGNGVISLADNAVTKAKLAGEVTTILNKVGTGAVETGNQKTVTGGAVKTYVDTATAGKLNKADLNVIESEDITVSNSGDLTKGKVKLSLKADKVKALAGTTNLATTYLKADGTNIAGNKVTFGGNVGTATLANTTELAQIKAVKAVDDKVAGNTQSITNLGGQITNLGNTITNVGKTSKEEVAIVQNSGLTLAKTVATANKGAVYTLGLDAVKVKEVAGTTTLAADLAAKANKDASNLTDPADVGKWKKKLGIDGLATNANIASKLEVDDIISTDKTVGIDTTTTAGKVDLKVNLDGTTLTKDGNGVISLADNAVTKAKLAGEVTTILNKVGTGTITDGNNNTVTGGAVKIYVDAVDTKVINLAGKAEGINVTVWQNQLLPTISFLSGGQDAGKIKLSDDFAFDFGDGLKVQTKGDKAIVSLDKDAIKNDPDFKLNSGTAGTKGKDGQSAFDLWKEQPGNTGKSKGDFLASLKGERGKDGTNIKFDLVDNDTDASKLENGETAVGNSGKIQPDANGNLKLNFGKNLDAKVETDGSLTLSAATVAKVDLKDADKIEINNTTIDNKGITINKGANINVNNGSEISINKGGNLHLQEGSKVTVEKNVDINMGGNQIHGIAAGTKPTDAVNLAQLNKGLKGVRKEANSGTSSAMAAASLPQAYKPGHSMVSLAGANYDKAVSIAIGLSSIFDNGKWIIKGNLNANTEGKVGVGIGAGYQW